MITGQYTLRGNPPKISSKFQFSKNSVFTPLNTGEYDKKIFFPKKFV